MEWQISPNTVDYKEALAAMEARVEAILAGSAPELGWLLEHPPLYTAGTSAREADLLKKSLFPVYEAGRGGEWTYHGPGQRVAYLMLDLKGRAQPAEPDLRRYVRQLEQWLIGTLKEFGVESFTREGRIGVWVKDGASESKIAALGIRVRKWVTFHGISLNVHPNLSHYAGIVPCGIGNYGVTSLKSLGVEASMQEVDAVLKKEFVKIFA